MLCALIPVLSLSLVATACGGEQEPAPAGDSDLEKTTITVGTIAVLGVAPLYIARNKGYFAEEGLEVKIETYPQPTAAVTAMIGGETDVTFSSYIPFFRAQAEGIAKFRIIAESSASAPNYYGVYVMPGSPIREVGDLAGKTIGVNARGLLATVLTTEALRTSGVDAAAVNYVEVPFAEMGAVLARGDIDAAFLAEPFLTSALTTYGLERIVDAGIGSVDELPVDGFGTTEGWAKQHRNTAAAFQRAIQRAAADAANRAEVEAVITDYAKIDPKMAPLIAPLRYPTSVSPIRLQRVADLMLSQGLLAERLDVEQLVGIPAG